MGCLSCRSFEDAEGIALNSWETGAGFRVGRQLVDRYTANRPRLADDLDVIKFICKEFWHELFHKQAIPFPMRTQHKPMSNSYFITVSWQKRSLGSSLIRISQLKVSCCLAILNWNYSQAYPLQANTQHLQDRHHGIVTCKIIAHLAVKSPLWQLR